jgi:hypothetical protein
MAFDPFGLQHPMDPEAVEPSLRTTMIGKHRPVRVRAFLLSSAKRPSIPATSPAATACLDIFSLPLRDSEVMSRLD